MGIKLVSVNKDNIEIPGKREQWIDVIKAIAAFLIVMQHSLSSSWTQCNTGDISWKILTFLFVISKTGVPLFFMCSGYGMLGRERSIKEILQSIGRLLIVYVSWMAVYGSVDVIKGIVAGDKAAVLVRAFVKAIIFGQYHVWFIFALIGLYLVTPIFYHVMKDYKLASYTVALTVAFTFIIAVFQQTGLYSRMSSTLGSVEYSYLSGYLAYYLLGMYLGSYINVRKSAAVILTVIMYLILSITEVLTTNETTLADPKYVKLILLIELVFCVAIFLTAKNISRDQGIYGILEKTVKYGFPIYLMHPLFLELTSGMTGLMSLVRGVLVYAISLLISIILYKIGITRFLFIKPVHTRSSDG